MESSVTSQVSPKVYNGDIKKLYKDDVDAESELFEINIFNHTLHIAPGKSIADEEHDKLVYFYVYAIKDEKVIANLGVYELLTDEQKLMYDISSFENLLLFDYYYTNPGIIKEFEIKGKNNIFDYIDTHLTTDVRVVDIYNTFTRYVKENKEFLGKHYTSYKKIILILSTDIRSKTANGKPNGLEGKIQKLKENCKTLDIFKLTLAILEPFYNVQFSFVDEGVSVTNFRDKTPPQTFEPTQYIIVSTDQTFVSTSSTHPGGGAEGGGAEEAPGDEDEGGGAKEAPEDDGAEGGGDFEVDEDGEVKEKSESKPELNPLKVSAKPSKNDESSASALEKEGGNVFNVGFKPKLKRPKGTKIPGLKSKNKEYAKESVDSRNKSENVKESKESSSATESKESSSATESKESSSATESSKPKARSSISRTRAEPKEDKSESKKESKESKESKPESRSKFKLSSRSTALQVSSGLGNSESHVSSAAEKDTSKAAEPESKQRSRIAPRPRQRSVSPASGSKLGSKP
jgi:hypothetical protein